MSDTTGTEQQPSAEPQQPTAPATGAEPQQPEAEVDWKAKFEQERQNARTWETRSKENFEKAQKFDQLEEASKSELQKAQEAAAKAAAEAQQARLDALRARTAATAGVPEDLLVGSTEEELTASVQRLLAFKGATEQQPAAPRSSGSDAPAGAAKPTVYRAEQLNDPEFYKAHRADILRAQQEGRIVS